MEMWTEEKSAVTYSQDCASPGMVFSLEIASSSSGATSAAVTSLRSHALAADAVAAIGAAGDAACAGLPASAVVVDELPVEFPEQAAKTNTDSKTAEARAVRSMVSHISIRRGVGRWRARPVRSATW